MRCTTSVRPSVCLSRTFDSLERESRILQRPSSRASACVERALIRLRPLVHVSCMQRSEQLNASEATGVGLWGAGLFHLRTRRVFPKYFPYRKLSTLHILVHFVTSHVYTRKLC